MNEKQTNYFRQLNEINVSEKIEKKNGLSYLSWAYAWAELKKLFPTANYKIYEREDGRNYFDDGRTAWVKTSVTVEEIEHIEYLPIMDFRNKSIPVEQITSFDVNKSIQRSLTKAVARHGLGLYIYAGEDLPENEEKKIETTVKKVTTKSKPVIQKEEAIDYKTKLIEKLKELGLDVNEYAKANKLSAKTTQEESRRLLEELENGVVA